MHRFRLTLASRLGWALALLAPVLAQAVAPTLTSAQLQGGTLTLQGLHFGTKPVAAPLKYENFDSRPVGALPTDIGYHNYGGFGGSVTVDDATAFSGGHALRHQANFGPAGTMVYESFPHIAVRGFSSSSLYLSYRMKFTGHGSRIDQLKFNRSAMEVDGANGSPCYGGMPKFRESYFPDSPSSGTLADKTIRHLQGGVVRDDGSLDEGWIGSVYPIPENTWVQVEAYYKLNDIGLANGEYVTYVNGHRHFDRHDLLVRSQANQMLNCSYLVVGMDYFINPESTDGVTVWYDDHYLDTTPARVVLANAAVWDQSTMRNPQPASTWSDGQITAQLQRAGFAPGSDAWLYVVAADGSVSPALKINLDATGPRATQLNVSNYKPLAPQVGQSLVVRPVLSFTDAGAGSASGIITASLNGVSCNFNWPVVPTAYEQPVDGCSLPLLSPGNQTVAVQFQSSDATQFLSSNAAFSVQVQADPLDTDADGVPNSMEPGLGLNSDRKDNDLYADTDLGRRLFVQQQFRDLLFREGGSTAVAYWQTQMGAGLSRQQLMQNFMNSAPGNSQIKPLGRMFLGLFNTLNAGLNSNGFLYYAHAVSAGSLSLDQAASQLLASSAFASAFGSLTDTQYATLVLHHVLGRAPSSQELTAALTSITGLGRAGYLRQRVEQADFVQASADRLFVQWAFLSLSRRVAPVTGEQYWLTRLQANPSAGRTELLNAFLGVLLPQYSGAAGLYRQRFISPVRMLLSENFDQATLPTSLNLGAQGGATLELVSDPNLTYGGQGRSLKATWPAMAAGDGGVYAWGGVDLVPYNSNHVYVRFRAKMPHATHGLKFVKVFGQRDPGAYANTTFGLDYTSTGINDGQMFATYFGDGSVPENDTQNIIQFDGGNPSWTGRSFGLPGYQVSTPQGKAFLGSDWGSTWHLFELYVKFNTGTSAQNEINDGAIQVKIDGKIYVDAKGLYNRHYSDKPLDSVQILGWSQTPRNTAVPSFEVWYDNVEVSLDGWSASPL